MEKHPRFQELEKKIDLWRKFVKMYDFGAPTEKGTWLYMNDDAIDDVCHYGPAKVVRKNNHVEMVKKHTDANGKLIISGGKDLKKSQAYPKGSFERNPAVLS